MTLEGRPQRPITWLVAVRASRCANAGVDLVGRWWWGFQVQHRACGGGLFGAVLQVEVVVAVAGVVAAAGAGDHAALA